MALLGARFAFDTRDGKTDELLYTWVVAPDGRIKTVSFERNVQSMLLAIEYDRPPGMGPGRAKGVIDVRISPAAERSGYALLEDLYRREGRLKDWESFKLYQARARKNPKVGHIPDAYLPDEVLRRRATWEQEQARLELPPPERGEPQAFTAEPTPELPAPEHKGKRTKEPGQ